MDKYKNTKKNTKEAGEKTHSLTHTRAVTHSRVHTCSGTCFTRLPFRRRSSYALRPPSTLHQLYNQKQFLSPSQRCAISISVFSVFARHRPTSRSILTLKQSFLAKSKNGKDPLVRRKAKCSEFEIRFSLRVSVRF
jgi:hypothetical protein